MNILNNKYIAAFNVALSVIMTALLIGFASRGTGNSDFGILMILVASDFITIFTATHMILSILTQNKQNQ